jgi:hypothetical protein
VRTSLSLTPVKEPLLASAAMAFTLFAKASTVGELNVMLLISVPLSDLARKYDLDQPGN